MNNRRMIKPCRKAVLSDIGLIPANIEIPEKKDLFTEYKFPGVNIAQFYGYDPAISENPRITLCNEYLDELVTTNCSSSAVLYSDDINSTGNSTSVFNSWNMASSNIPYMSNTPIHYPAFGA